MMTKAFPFLLSCFLGFMQPVYAQQGQKTAQGMCVLEQKFYDALAPGIYQHYKGHFYQVYEIAQKTENCEYFVVYRPLYGEKKLALRPLLMFRETVIINNASVPRFKLVVPASDIAPL